MNAAYKLTLTTLASLCALAGGCFLWSAPALAARSKVLGSTFGSAGAGNGQISSSVGIAVNDTTGDVYVVDGGNNRVEYFSSTGAYEGQFNGSGAPTGSFLSPTYIAIDNDPESPSFEDVYVVNSGNEVLDKFNSTGKYEGQLTTSLGGGVKGIATDSTGDLWVWGGRCFVEAFGNGLANERISGFPSTACEVENESRPGFAVDSNDTLYTDATFLGISKLNSAGVVQVRTFAPQAEGVAVDLSTNEVYIDQSGNSIERFSADGLVHRTL